MDCVHQRGNKGSGLLAPEPLPKVGNERLRADVLQQLDSSSTHLRWSLGLGIEWGGLGQWVTHYGLDPC